MSIAQGQLLPSSPSPFSIRPCPQVCVWGGGARNVQYIPLQSHPGTYLYLQSEGQSIGYIEGKEFPAHRLLSPCGAAGHLHAHLGLSGFQSLTYALLLPCFSEDHWVRRSDCLSLYLFLSVSVSVFCCHCHFVALFCKLYLYWKSHIHITTYVELKHSHIIYLSWWWYFFLLLFTNTLTGLRLNLHSIL